MLEMRFLTITLAALLATAALLGCGGDGDSSSGDNASSTEIPGGADPEAARVIDEWSKTLSEGDVEGAAEFFEIPSTAQNGTPPVELRTRAAVVAFNEALPCGAELIRAEPHGDEIILATFELTERPGPGECGGGVGAEATTAFIIEDGKIAEWVRAVGDADEPPPVTGPVV
jgi:hypothetical protein